MAWLLALGVCAGTASVTSADTDTDEEARALYQAGRIAFDQGRFESALDYFQRSYELSGRPALLFNIGSAADRLRRDAVALDAFERYLEAVPDSPDAASVRARIEVLRAAIAADRAAPQPDDDPEDEPEPTDEPYLDPEPVIDYGVAPISKKRRALGWIFTSAGAAVTFTGFALFAVGQVKRSDIENAVPGTRWSDVEASQNADAFTATGAVFTLVGLGTAATGMVFLLKRDAAPAARALKVSPGIGGLSLSGSF